MGSFWRRYYIYLWMLCASLYTKRVGGIMVYILQTFMVWSDLICKLKKFTVSYSSDDVADQNIFNSLVQQIFLVAKISKKI